jgi:hypothetical protein
MLEHLPQTATEASRALAIVHLQYGVFDRLTDEQHARLRRKVDAYGRLRDWLAEYESGAEAHGCDQQDSGERQDTMRPGTRKRAPAVHEGRLALSVGYDTHTDELAANGGEAAAGQIYVTRGPRMLIDGRAGLLRHRAARSARLAHNQEVPGSNPGAATESMGRPGGTAPLCSQRVSARRRFA